jgi:1,4-dihydroxy-2-naphthoate polyprenyltransferase
VVPVVVGTAAADRVVAWRFVAALVVAVAIQVGTNFANDVGDGVRGTDANRVGPVRLVASGLATPTAVRRAAAAAFGVAAVAGLALAAATTWWLLVVGAASMAAGWLYTGGPRPYGYLGLGEVFVFVFFGLVATVGSGYVQDQRVTWLMVIVAVPVGLLATALLVVNNLRDIATDAVAGKRTLAVRLGDRATRRLYVALAGVAGPFARRPIRAVLAGATGPALVPVLQDTARAQLWLGGLLALVLWLR